LLVCVVRKEWRDARGLMLLCLAPACTLHSLSFPSIYPCLCTLGCVYLIHLSGVYLNHLSPVSHSSIYLCVCACACRCVYIYVCRRPAATAGLSRSAAWLWRTTRSLLCLCSASASIYVVLNYQQAVCALFLQSTGHLCVCIHGGMHSFKP